MEPGRQCRRQQHQRATQVDATGTAGRARAGGRQSPGARSGVWRVSSTAMKHRYKLIPGVLPQPPSPPRALGVPVLVARSCPRPASRRRTPAACGCSAGGPWPALPHCAHQQCQHHCGDGYAQQGQHAGTEQRAGDPQHRERAAPQGGQGQQLHKGFGVHRLYWPRAGPSPARTVSRVYGGLLPWPKKSRHRLARWRLVAVPPRPTRSGQTLRRRNASAANPSPTSAKVPGSGTTSGPLSLVML